MELLEAFEDYETDKITTLFNAIHDTDQILPDISKSISIALPKKQGAKECELHRKVSPMSHITKILLRIIMI